MPAYLPISRDKRGFTLIEVVCAMFITLVGLLGLLQGLNLANEHNLKNQMRDEVVQVAEQQMSNFMARPFADISTSAVAGQTYNYAPQKVASRLRGATKNYTVTRGVNTLPNNNVESTALGRELVVRVRFAYKNFSTTHEIHSMRVQ